jgi:hypothetical protein
MSLRFPLSKPAFKSFRNRLPALLEALSTSTIASAFMATEKAGGTAMVDGMRSVQAR